MIIQTPSHLGHERAQRMGGGEKAIQNALANAAFSMACWPNSLTVYQSVSAFLRAIAARRLWLYSYLGRSAGFWPRAVQIKVEQEFC